MKILWFTNTPSLAEDYLNNKPMNGGFIRSLEKIMQEKVDLSIAFYHSKEMEFFKQGNTTYYPIKSNNSSFPYTIKKRYFHEIEPESDVDKFLEVAKKVRPDLIHIHGSERPFGLIQKFLSIPTVVSIQGNISVYKLKFFSGISLLDTLKYSGLRDWLLFNTNFNQYIRFKKQAKREKEIFKLSRNFIGRTSWDKRITKILAPNSNYFHNDEVLRDSFYEEKWFNKFSKTLRLFTINGPDIYKGIETLIACAHLLDLNNVNYTWKVAGLNFNDNLVRIATKILKKKLSGNIHFLGRLDDFQVKQNVLNSNIYVAVSHIENSPNSLCEALLLGAPCIATYAGGTSSFIEDGKNGILVQDGDPFSMAGAIMELKENYDIAIKYGIAARNKALLRHNKDIISNDLLKIYQTILRDEK
jgi:glycosyltransferase involved in cell wall biosynthesis